MDNYAAALMFIEDAIVQEPEDASLYVVQGRVYYDQKRYGEAINSFDKAIEIDQESAEAYYRRALSFY